MLLAAPSVFVGSAAASKAKSMGVPVTHIMAKAGWSRAATFAKYYDKNTTHGNDHFQEAVLEYFVYKVT